MLMEPFIQLHTGDNVVIALQHLDKGFEIPWNGQIIKLADTIGFGHKIAIHRIEKGAKILKYGLPIGSATQTIAAGNHVHVHNLKSDYTIDNVKQQH